MWFKASIDTLSLKEMLWNAQFLYHSKFWQFYQRIRKAMPIWLFLLSRSHFLFNILLIRAVNLYDQSYWTLQNDQLFISSSLPNDMWHKNMPDAFFDQSKVKIRVAVHSNLDMSWKKNKSIRACACCFILIFIFE